MGDDCYLFILFNGNLFVLYSSERLLKKLRAHKVDELILTVREVKHANPRESTNDMGPSEET